MCVFNNESFYEDEEFDQHQRQLAAPLVSKVFLFCSVFKLRKSNLEVETDDEGKGKSEMTRYREKFGERKGVIDLLECLEKEAIMGDDEGKEPNDYN